MTASVEPAKGGIADDADRADLVENAIDPNDMADWRVVVVAGGGEVGPYSEE